ncbi:flotillin family protein [Membranihabitans maritimus]|uniref:flotillin family protein n=1 Tax=Membranihabitans maritimus TaxID=2904244 RepID=UPI001EFF2729|nr:flotillin family protein [Membranihabitans maritimus]
MNLDVTLIIMAGLIGLVILLLLLFVTRYKRCPSDKILVIYGKTGSGSAKCVAGGAAFVWPIIQDYAYLDLSPISIDVDLKNALSRQNIRVNVPSRFTVAVSNDEGTMVNAAERLLGKSIGEIRDIAKDIIFGQLRLVVATMDIEEINSDRDKFLSNIASNVGSELKKIGLVLINVNITDIEDESGYIVALGREAAAHAVNEAKVRVAEREREGAIGASMAQKEQRIKVSSYEAEAVSGEADAKRMERIRISEADALAIEGENNAKIKIAASDAIRREREAEALRKATASEKIQAAKALEEAYLAEQEAELARANRERAKQEADEIVDAEIEKRKIAIAAEAEAERQRLIAKGEADAIFMKKEAEARGMLEILEKQSEGFDKIVKAANGNTRDAVLMVIADKLEELVKTQVEAIKNIKIDKVTVWEGGNENSQGNGQNSTSKFISGLYRSVPPMHDLFDMAGMNLPEYLGTKNSSDGNSSGDSQEPSEEAVKNGTGKE